MNSIRLYFGRPLQSKALALVLVFSFVIIPFEPVLLYASEEVSFNSSAIVGTEYTFSSPGYTSWTVPDGVTSVKVMAWGGGGAGGSGEKITGTNRSGLGGGAGGYAEKTISVTPGDSYSIVVGQGGQGILSVLDGRVGKSGMQSRFEGGDVTLVAYPGTGGASYTGGGNPSEPIGMGGAAEGGDVNQSGGNGGGYSVDGDGNPHASSGGSAMNGGAGGERGRCGRDGHCPGSDPASAWAKDGGFPGGGGGGSDVAEGGYGAGGQVIVQVVSVETPAEILGPVGFLDEVNCSVIRGWTYDKDNSSVSIGVHFYTLNSAEEPVFIGNTEANVSRPDVNAADGVEGDHGFEFAFPASLKDGQPHKIYAFGMDSNGNSDNNVLNNSPIQVTCAPSGGGTTPPPGPGTPAISSTLTHDAGSCTASGTNITYTATVTGPSDMAVVLEKDTNGDNSFGQVASYTGPGTYTYTTNEAANYAGTYTLRLAINGSVTASASVVVTASCGGTPPPPPPQTGLTATFSTTASCVASGTSIPFTVTVSGPGPGTVTLEKDTNGDGSFGQVASYSTAGSYQFLSSEPATYTGTYTLRLLVNGSLTNSLVVTVAANCNNTNVPNPSAPARPVVNGPSTGVANTAYTFSAVAGDPDSSTIQYNFNWGDGSESGYGALQATGIFFAASHAWSTAGTYAVTVTARDPEGNVSPAGSALIVISATGGGGGGGTTPNPITGSLSTSSTGCIAAGTNVPFTITVGGDGVTSVVLEKDTNADAVFGQVASWTTAGTQSFTTNEAASYTGTYTLRLIVNGTVMDTESVVVSATCGGGGPATGGDGTTITTGGGGSGGSGGGSGSRRRCTGFGCPTTVDAAVIPGDILITFDNFQPVANTGGGSAITGPERVCPAANFIQTFLRLGLDNDPNEVRKLQYFLNTYEGAGLDVTGDFDLATEEAVKTLQSRHSEEILSPWGVSEPTGIVYLTTTRYINTVYCADNPGYTGNEDLKDILDRSIIDLTPIDPDDFDGLIGSAEPDTGNIAGVFGAFMGRLGDFLKDISLYGILILLLLIAGTWLTLYGALKKDLQSDLKDMNIMRGLTILAIGSVLNVLNTLSFIINPEWLTQKTGLSLSWVLGLDLINMLLVIALCLVVLFTLYSKITKIQVK